MGALVINHPLPAEATAGREAARPGAWKRFIDAIVESRRIAVERQLVAYFDRHPELTRPAGLERRPAWKQAADALPF